MHGDNSWTTFISTFHLIPKIPLSLLSSSPFRINTSTTHKNIFLTTHHPHLPTHQPTNHLFNPKTHSFVTFLHFHFIFIFFLSIFSLLSISFTKLTKFLLPPWKSTFSTFLPPSPCATKLPLLSSPRKSASSTQIWLHDFVIFSFRFQASFTFLPMYVLDLGLYRLDHLHFRCSTWL